MTLVIGVKLPKGVLIVSDTRVVDPKTHKILGERQRKIIPITPSIYLATSGSESNWHVSRILRECLYMNAFQFSSEQIRMKILEFYSSANSFHMENQSSSFPFGGILLAEYNTDRDEFSLLHQQGNTGFDEFNIFNTLKDVEAIGASEEIRSEAKRKVSEYIDTLGQEELNNGGIFEDIAKYIHNIIKSQDSISIGDNTYSVYLTEQDKKPASITFFLNTDNELTITDRSDPNEIINLS